MTHKDDLKVNNIDEWNLLHDLINPSKHTKILNIHYSTIIRVCMNTRKRKSKFNNFQILLDSGCSSTIVILGLV